MLVKEEQNPINICIEFKLSIFLWTLHIKKVFLYRSVFLFLERIPLPYSKIDYHNIYDLFIWKFFLEPNLFERERKRASERSELQLVSYKLSRNKLEPTNDH